MRKGIGLSVFILGVVMGIVLGIWTGVQDDPNQYITEQYFPGRQELLQFLSAIPVEESSKITIDSIEGKIPSALRDKYIAVRIRVQAPTKVKVDLPHAKPGAWAGIWAGCVTFGSLALIAAAIAWGKSSVNH